MEAEKIEAPEIQNGQAAEDKIRPTHTLNLYDFTTPTKITKPATVPAGPYRHTRGNLPVS